MTFNPPTNEEWRHLYAAANQIKQLAPWEWMEESDVFGFQNPDTGDLGFVSVMGTLGEHLAVAVYQGAESLYRFWNIHEAGPFEDPETILEISHLQASFEDRNNLTARDRKVKKELGLKFRGRQAWPMFRSYRPGFAPWYIESEEARLLTYALEQLADVASRFEADPGLLDPGEEDEYLVRLPQQLDGEMVWADSLTRVPLPEPGNIPIPMDPAALDYLKTLKQGKGALEVDFFWTPIQIQENRRERPRFGYTFLVVDAESGMVLDSNIAGVETSLEEMWGNIPMLLVRALVRIGVIPWQVRVENQMMQVLMSVIGQELGFSVKLAGQLPMLDQARDFLISRFI